MITIFIIKGIEYYFKIVYNYDAKFFEVKGISLWILITIYTGCFAQ